MWDESGFYSVLNNLLPKYQSNLTQPPLIICLCMLGIEYKNTNKKRYGLSSYTGIYEKMTVGKL